MKTDYKKEYLEIMIKRFKELNEQFPEGGFGQTLANLQGELAAYNGRIGRMNRFR